MNFSELLDTLVTQTTQTALVHFRPELVLCVTIVALLLGRMLKIDRVIPTYCLTLAGTLVSLYFAYTQFGSIQAENFEVSETFFTGLLVYDGFTVFFRLFLLVFLMLVIALTVLSGIPDNEDGPDFYALLLGSAIGMMVMASANNLLMLFLGVEMASVPSFVMVAFLKGRKASSEGALKFVIYGAGAAGVMLYGISLIAGTLGTTDFGQISVALNTLLEGETSAGLGNASVRVVVLGILMVLTGLAFKLSVVPFHFWAPDAFEGASAEVGGYLSVASKAATFALLVRFLLAFIDPDPGKLQGVYLALGLGLGVVGVITSTFGNLAAYAQTNVKRLLAYSTIAHAGYMLLAVSAMVVILSSTSTDPEFNKQFQAIKAMEGLLYYLGAYLFMNLGAFAIVALIRNHIYSEEIEDYNGIAAECPVLCVGMLICMFSLIGMPPFGGFVGKLMIFASVFQAGAVHPLMYAILVLAGMNTVFSLFYYLNVLKAMFLKPRPETSRRVNIPAASEASAYVASISFMVLFLGVIVAPLSNVASNVAKILFP